MLAKFAFRRSALDYNRANRSEFTSTKSDHLIRLERPIRPFGPIIVPTRIVFKPSCSSPQHR
jgi:hypothetical protein